MKSKLLLGAMVLYIGILMMVISWVNKMDIKSSIYPTKPCIKLNIKNVG